jgi:hypothetical protein
MIGMILARVMLRQVSSSSLTSCVFSPLVLDFSVTGLCYNTPNHKNLGSV